MSEGVRNLIDAIINGDSIQIDQSFNHEMAERISTRLDTMRVEVAKNMFNEQVEELDEEQLDELSKTTLGSYAHKAVDKAQDHAHDAHDSYRLSDKEQAQHVHKMAKRLQGVERAGKALGDKTIGKSAEKSVDYHLKQRQAWDNWNRAEAGKHDRAALRNSDSAHNKITKASGVKENYELDEEQLDEMINEVLSKDATAGEWIDDFVHSKDPKFAGKSKEKRKQMALAAYYAKQRNESIEDLDEEQLDELSKDTLKSYIDKAATRLVSGDKYKGMDRYNRVDGIKKATSKLVKQK
jgi:hypothetical protein